MKRFTVLRAFALLLSLILLISLVGCSASAKARPTSNANKVVATAGEAEIMYDELYYLAMTRIDELKAEDPAALESAEVRADLEKFVWENLLTESHALLVLGEAYGLDVEKGEIADSVQEQIDTIVTESFEGDRDAYIESLNKAHLTDRYVRTYIAVQDYLAIEIIKVMLERGELDDSDEAAQRFIDDGDEDEHNDMMIRVEQVLIETANYKNAEAARAKAEELRAAVAAHTDEKARAAAMRLAMQYSTYLGTADGLYFARGEMAQDFEQTAFSLDHYAVSEVIEVESGFCFVMRLPKDEAYIARNFEMLKQKAYFVTLNQKVEKLLSEMTLEKTELGASLDLTSLPEIDANGGQWRFVLVWCLVGAAVLGVGGYFTYRGLKKYAAHPKKK